MLSAGHATNGLPQRATANINCRIFPGVSRGCCSGLTGQACRQSRGYGIDGLFQDPNGGNLHGLNERNRVKYVYEGRTFLYRLVKLYADHQ